MALAIHAALGAIATAQAQSDPKLLELVAPKSTIELGAGSNNATSAKAEEWTGIQHKGAFPLLNFELQGGGAYDSKDANRWRIVGTDLGTDSRSLSFEQADQGTYRVRLGYDELRHNQSDSYRTPYLGIGGNALTLPSNWLKPVVPRISGTTVNARGLSPDVTASNAIVPTPFGVSTAPTAAQLNQAAAVQAADLSAFNRVDLFTKRTRVSMAWDQELNERWSLSASLSSERKEGIKALTGHADAPAETSTVLPFPVNQDDEKARVSLAYNGDALHWQAAVEVSAFTNNVPSVSWRMWSVDGNSTATPNVATMSNGGPSSLFHKVLASGSYQIDAANKLIGDVSYARTRQNEAFPTDDSSLGTLAKGYALPRASAQALVVAESAGLKLINRSVKGLSLSAALRYDLRENRTPVDTYIYYDNNTTPSATLSPFAGLYGNPAGLGSNVNINTNTPYSKRVVQGDLDAVYQLGHGDQVRAGLTEARTHRYCIGSWIDCANASEATETTLHADWHGHLAEPLSANVRLSASHRSVDYNELAFLARVPMANLTPTGAPAGTTAYSTLLALGLNGYGRSLGLTPAPATGSAEAFYFTPSGTKNYNNVLQQLYYGNRNRMVEENGLRTFDQADRNRTKAHTALTWQASDALTLQAGIDGGSDRYDRSKYGLQKSSHGAFNLDLSYAANEDLVVTLFGSAEQQRTRITGNSIQTGVNSTATSVNGATAISGDGACFTTIATRNASYKIDPCLDWAMTVNDRTLTIGANVRRNRLLKGKLDLSGGLVYSDGRTDTDVAGGFYVNNPYAGIAGAATKDTAAYYDPATPFPTNRTKSVELRLGGEYHLSADDALRLGYSYRWLRGSDWGYEGMQPGGLTVNLPTFESAPAYRVHSIAISYAWTFR
jgi:MtrB/PioB family decaheme-associated outer membrane protein